MIKVNNLTTKPDFPSLRSDVYLRELPKDFSEAQRFGIILTAWLAGHRGKEEAATLEWTLDKLVGMDRPEIIPTDNGYIINLNLKDAE